MGLVPNPDGSVSSAVPTAPTPGAAPLGVSGSGKAVSPGMPGAPGSPVAPKAVDKETTAGILFGIGAYGLWGLLPLYFLFCSPPVPWKSWPTGWSGP